MKRREVKFNMKKMSVTTTLALLLVLILGTPFLRVLRRFERVLRFEVE